MTTGPNRRPYHVAQADWHVVVVAYWASLDPGQDELASVLSTEHGHVGLFNRTEVDQLLMPAGYRPSVTGW